MKREFFRDVHELENGMLVEKYEQSEEARLVGENMQR